MDTDTYMTAWKRVEPQMRAELAALAVELRTNNLVLGESTQGGDEEFWLDTPLYLSVPDMEGYEKVAVAYVKFTLNDAEANGEEEPGFGICLKWEGAEGEVMSSQWNPYVYTEQMFTMNVEEILNRLAKEFDSSVEKIAGSIAVDVLQLCTPDYLDRLKRNK